MITSQKIKSLRTNLVMRYILPIFFWMENLEFRIAQDQSDLDAIYELGWEVYGKELGYINPSDYPDKRYTDKYDNHSIIFLCLRKHKPIGTLRLISDSSLGFYIERDFPIIQLPIERVKIAELSRFVVLKKYRGGLHLASLGLIRLALKYSQASGFEYWYILMGSSLKRAFSKYGVSIDPLSYGELSEQQIEERRQMQYYYKTVNPLPYIVRLNGTN